MHYRFSLRLCAITFSWILGAGCGSFVVYDTPAMSADSNTPKRPVPRLVLAFYYAWYGTPEKSGRWVHWEGVDTANKRIANSTHYPALGAYDSHDPRVLERHCQQAKHAGMDGFIVSWWRPGDFHDQGFPLLLDIAHKHGLAVCAYIETVPKKSIQQAVEYASYLLTKYSQHPAWLRVKNKPVLFVYARALDQVGLDNWRRVIFEVEKKHPPGAIWIADRLSPSAARLFDGIHTYNITEHLAGKTPEQIRQWAQTHFPRWVRLAEPKISCLTILPGYDDRKLLERKPPRPVTARHHGETYKVLWQEAIAAQPDWILITSWNEWHEGTEIEPSLEHGHRELETTRLYSEKFKQASHRRP